MEGSNNNNDNSQVNQNTSEERSEDGFIFIDGSYKEGGGQILRNCVSLSAILKKPIKIGNIRGGREKGGWLIVLIIDHEGLKAQHLCGIELVSDLCGAQLTGAVIGSTEVTFSPGDFQGKKHVLADIHTAGYSLKISLPVLLFGSKEMDVELRGGTDVSFSPPLDYTATVFAQIAQLFGVEFAVEVKKRGYFPKGGGICVLRVKPVLFLKPIDLVRRGSIVAVKARSFVAGNQPVAIAQKMSSHAARLMNKHLSTKVKTESESVKEVNCIGNGSGILITAISATGCILGASELGEKNKDPEKIAENAASELIANLKQGGAVDEYLQDQLIILAALAKGTSRFKCGPLTGHTETSVHFAQAMTGAKITVSKCPDELKESNSENTYLIEIEGIGWENPFLKNEDS